MMEMQRKFAELLQVFDVLMLVKMQVVDVLMMTNGMKKMKMTMKVFETLVQQVVHFLQLQPHRFSPVK